MTPRSKREWTRYETRVNQSASVRASLDATFLRARLADVDRVARQKTEARDASPDRTALTSFTFAEAAGALDENVVPPSEVGYG